MSEKNVERAVEALRQDRRLPAAKLDDEEAALVQPAARLRAARPEATQPSSEFVDRLARRLRATEGSTSRRRFLRAAGAVAAAAAAGVAADRVLDATVLHPAATPAPTSELVPVAGTWRAVTTLAALRTTPVVRFSSGAVQGFVIQSAGTVSAMSAVCTHQGCILAASPDRSELVCPCHNQTFGLDGRPAAGYYPLPPLPRIPHRIRGDAVEVFVT